MTFYCPYRSRLRLGVSVLACLLALFTPLASHAQREYSPNLAIGFQGGMTLSQMAFSPSVKQQWAQGFIGGVAARYTEENHFGLIGELNIEQRGWKEDFEEKAAQFDYTRRLTYIQLALLTHLYWGKKWRFFVNAGPEVGYMLGSKITSNFDYQDYLHIPDFPTRNRTCQQMVLPADKRFDFGISAGLGLEWFYRPRQSMHLEARFYYGLGNIFPCTKRDYFSAARGMSLEITMGWMMRVR